MNQSIPNRYELDRDDPFADLNFEILQPSLIMPSSKEQSTS